jgi:hypothetical protein
MGCAELAVGDCCAEVPFCDCWPAPTVSSRLRGSLRRRRGLRGAVMKDLIHDRSEDAHRFLLLREFLMMPAKPLSSCAAICYAAIGRYANQPSVPSYFHDSLGSFARRT